MHEFYTPEQWASFQPLLGHMTGRGIEIARLVMVEGKKGVDVAKQYDTSPQNVGQMVKKARLALEKSKAEGLVPAVIWLPQGVVELLGKLNNEQIASAIAEAGKAVSH